MNETKVLARCCGTCDFFDEENSMCTDSGNETTSLYYCGSYVVQSVKSEEDVIRERVKSIFDVVYGEGDNEMECSIVEAATLVVLDLIDKTEYVVDKIRGRKKVKKEKLDSVKILPRIKYAKKIAKAAMIDDKLSLLIKFEPEIVKLTDNYERKLRYCEVAIALLSASSSVGKWFGYNMGRGRRLSVKTIKGIAFGDENLGRKQRPFAKIAKIGAPIITRAINLASYRESWEGIFKECEAKSVFRDPVLFWLATATYISLV